MQGTAAIMNIEIFKKEDIAGLTKLQPEGWSDITKVYGNYLTKDFYIPMKVVTEGVISGIGTAIILGKTAWLAHIIVHPGFRKMGIGSFIVEKLLEDAYGSGCESVSLIATDLGHPVYKKSGFTDQTEYIYLSGERLTDTGKESENISGPTDMEAVFCLDKKASGENRLMMINGNFEICRTYRMNGKMTGYYLPDLGEGLIVADGIEAGIELLRLRSLCSEKVSLPVDNTEGISFLKKNGYKETGRTFRMIHGKEFLWHPEMIFNRIGGYLG
jgi:GNAT superfamily N-acetyltransferase